MDKSLFWDWKECARCIPRFTLRQIRIWSLLFLATLFLAPAHAATLFVDGRVAASGDGTTWTQALKTVGEALDAADAGDDVWVASGTYYTSITMKSGVGLYGGFTGDETSPEERNIRANETVIDASTALNGGPAYHVIMIRDVTTATLDGLTITGGYIGGDIRSSELADDSNVLRNCTVTNNGRGVYFERSAAILVNCTITSNRCAGSGGGIMCFGSSPTLLNCTISQNSAQGDGGAIYTYSSATMINCTIASNTASQDGGGVYMLSASVDFLNCTISGNKAGGSGGGIVWSAGSEPRIRNCIIAGNSPTGLDDTWPVAFPRRRVEHCLFFDNSEADCQIYRYPITGANEINLCVPGALGNVSGDPRFIDAAAGDYRLGDGSSALDRGSTITAPSLDFEGNPRPGTDGLVDIGADEADATFLPPADETAPVAEIRHAPEITKGEPFNLEYLASDAESGVRHVEILYRKDGGAWQKTGETFEATSGSLQFDPGDSAEGLYEFYAAATDNAGNVEKPPAVGDAETVLVRSFEGSQIYVDRRGSGATGRNWNDAYHRIGAALATAQAFRVNEIWVAEGTYPESVTFFADFGVRLYGGYSGDESSPTDRNVRAHPSILDSSKVRDGMPAYHTVTFDGVSNVAFDGFTVTGGFANGPDYHTNDGGGGIACFDADETNAIRNCTIIGNRAFQIGAGIYYRRSSVLLASSIVTANWFVLDEYPAGGGIYCSESSPEIRDTAVTGHQSALHGGGMYIGYGSNPTLLRCTISGNSSVDGGAFVSRFACSPSFTNCIISGNAADYCPAAVLGSGKPTFTNCTISRNESTGPSVGAIWCYEGNESSIINTVFEGNSQFAIAESQWTEPNLVATNCLFDSNTSGTYWHTPLDDRRICLGADDLNRCLPSAQGNLDGDPGFLMDGPGAIHGSWTSEPLYDPETFCTTLVELKAEFVPDELAGKLIELTTGTLQFHALIASNSTTEIIVFGDLTNRASISQPYTIVNYRPLWDSAAVDSGTGTQAPATDIEGNPRPVDIPGLGAEGTGFEFDIGAYEAQETILPSTRAEPGDWVLYE